MAVSLPRPLATKLQRGSGYPQKSHHLSTSNTSPAYLEPNPYLLKWNGHSFTHIWPEHVSDNCRRCRRGWCSDSISDFDTEKVPDTKEYSFEVTTIPATDNYTIQNNHQQHDLHRRNSRVPDISEHSFSASLSIRKEIMTAKFAPSKKSSWAALLGLRRP